MLAKYENALAFFPSENYSFAVNRKNRKNLLWNVDFIALKETNKALFKSFFKRPEFNLSLVEKSSLSREGKQPQVASPLFKKCWCISLSATVALPRKLSNGFKKPAGSRVFHLWIRCVLILHLKSLSQN